MALSDPIPVRLSHERRAAYEAEAAEREMPLGQFLRERLDAAELLYNELAGIRMELASLMKREPGTANSVSSADAGMLLEILLLTRQRAKPDELRMWQAEVARNGLKVWGGK